MTIQIPASRHDDLAVGLAARIEHRLTTLAAQLEHAGVEVYDTDQGLATRGGIVRMSLADLSAIVAQVALDGSAVIRPDSY
jgi:Fe-S cluster assembly scaffold protein SufB